MGAVAWRVSTLSEDQVRREIFPRLPAGVAALLRLQPLRPKLVGKMVLWDVPTVSRSCMAGKARTGQRSAALRSGTTAAVRSTGVSCVCRTHWSSCRSSTVVCKFKTASQFQLQSLELEPDAQRVAATICSSH